MVFFNAFKLRFFNKLILIQLSLNENNPFSTTQPWTIKKLTFNNLNIFVIDKYSDPKTLLNEKDSHHRT